MKILKLSFFLFICLFIITSSQASVSLPALFSDNMVLQRNSHSRIWGKADQGELVKIRTSWNNQYYEVKTDELGNWEQNVETPDAGGPYQMTIEGKSNTVVFSNILIGEVWIGSGQSNMEMYMKGFGASPINNSLKTILEGTQFTDIRLFNVEKNVNVEQQWNCGGEWLMPTTQSIAEFSAVAYFFALNLYKILNIPVGIITSNWGGSKIEAWMPERVYDDLTGIEKIKVTKKTTKIHTPAMLYNGMIAPIEGYTAKGFIWYQGESNIGNYQDYPLLTQAMVNSWRSLWNNADMPFYAVQICAFDYENDETNWKLPYQMEAQFKTKELIPKYDVVATLDLGDLNEIHPAKKEEVGQRLSYLALNNDYKIPIPGFRTPEFEKYEIKGDKLILFFDKGSSIEVGYFDNSVGELIGFELAGKDKVYYPAKAKLDGWQSRIELTCDQVSNPVAARYGFQLRTDMNLKNVNKIPAPPFRTDDW